MIVEINGRGEWFPNHWELVFKNYHRLSPETVLNPMEITVRANMGVEVSITEALWLRDKLVAARSKAFSEGGP